MEGGGGEGGRGEGGGGREGEREGEKEREGRKKGRKGGREEVHFCQLLNPDGSIHYRRVICSPKTRSRYILQTSPAIHTLLHMVLLSNRATGKITGTILRLDSYLGNSQTVFPSTAFFFFL